MPDKVVIQLNDTHPVVAIPELMRLLVDVHHAGLGPSLEHHAPTFAYTCHTLLPEALEKWPVDLFGSLLPRHLEIIYEINRRFLDEVRLAFPGDEAALAPHVDHRRSSRCGSCGWPTWRASAALPSTEWPELQSRLLRERTLHDFAELWPEKFQNKTNGVTPRRFVRLANPGLSELITSRIGDGWLTDLEQLARAGAVCRRPGIPGRLAGGEAAEQAASGRVAAAATAAWIVERDSLFDVMVKRLHEYKRQLLKALHIISLYHRLQGQSPAADIVPRTFVFGAKAAPGYFMAKRIIKLIHSLARVVNQRSGRARAAEGRVPRQLQRLDGRDDLPRRGSLRTDLAGRQRGVRAPAT